MNYVIQLKPDQKPVELTEKLLMAALKDTINPIVSEGASKSTTSMGFLELRGKKMLLSIVVDTDWD
jgi:hypothetical protein